MCAIKYFALIINFIVTFKRFLPFMPIMSNFFKTVKNQAPVRAWFFTVYLYSAIRVIRPAKSARMTLPSSQSAALPNTGAPTSQDAVTLPSAVWMR